MDVCTGRGTAGKRVSISFEVVSVGKRRVAGWSLVATVLLVSAAAACRGMMPRQYEYDAVVDLSLDGSATLHINGSVPALVALHGIDLDTRPNARLDRAAIRRFFTSGGVSVQRIGTSRRRGRRFVHLRLSVPDIRRLGDTRAFANTSARLTRDGSQYVYEQSIGAPAGAAVSVPDWTGQELVAYQLHLPSRILFHNAPSREVERGNILIWEQTLSQRLAGTPVEIEARMEPQSILYTTLWLFGAMALLVVAMFVAIIWLVVRRGRREEEGVGA